MKIGLFGFSFEDRNKGCEALTYSFINVLDTVIEGDLYIINFSGVGKTERITKDFPQIHFEDAPLKKNCASLVSLKKLMECDVVFDCTFGDNFSDIYSLRFVKKTTLYKEMSIFLGKRLVLAPQTIGPFTDEKIKHRAGRVLDKCFAVYTRDALSADYVRSISNAVPQTFTDLAFMLPFNDLSKNRTGRRVAINVSGLLWKGGFKNNNQFGLSLDYHYYTRQIIRYLIEEKYDVILIPHVFESSGTEIDEDYSISCALAREFGLSQPTWFDNPIDVKSFISSMDIFIGARMHSTIAAFSSGVATIPFSYSRKFEGLYNSLGYSYIIDGRRLETERALELTKQYINNLEMLKKQQCVAMEATQRLCDSFKKEIEKCFK